MIDLRPCPACQRHVTLAEPRCPFCAAALAPEAPREIPRGRRSRAAVFATATLATACAKPAPPVDQHPVVTSAPDAAALASPASPDAAPLPPPVDAVIAAIPAIPDASVPAPSPAPAPAPKVGTCVINGVVTNSRNGKPAARLPVELAWADGSQPERQTATDDLGRYTFAKLPATAFIVKFGYERPRSRPAQATVTLRPREIKQVDRAVYIPEPSNVPMPYGAPPARRRTV
jgi:hypothetical protein